MGREEAIYREIRQGAPGIKLITHDHKKLYMKLHKGHLDKPQIVDTPTVKVKLHDSAEGHTLEIGGDKTIVHYSQWKEDNHRRDKMNKRFRHLRKQIKLEAHRRNGEELPTHHASPVTPHDVSGRTII